MNFLISIFVSILLSGCSLYFDSFESPEDAQANCKFSGADRFGAKPSVKLSRSHGLNIMSGHHTLIAVKGFDRIGIEAMFGSTSWMFLDKCVDSNQKEIEVTKINSDVECSHGSCSHFEEIRLVPTYDLDYLVQNALKNYQIKCSGRGGVRIFDLPSEEILGFAACAKQLNP